MRPICSSDKLLTLGQGSCHRRLAALGGGSDERVAMDATWLDQTRIQLERSFDRRRGGFGDQPKFPRPTELLFLLREHVRTGEPAPRDMVLQYAPRVCDLERPASSPKATARSAMSC